MTPVTSRGYVRPLYCVGDSHTDSLNGMLLVDPITETPLAVGVALFAIPTAASMMGDAEGAIAATLVPLLYAMRLLRFAAASTEPALVLGPRTFAVHPYAQTRWLMLFAGELDARYAINAVPLDATVDVPDFDETPFEHHPVQRVVLAHSLESELSKRIAPLIALVEKLRELGIERVALTSIPPPTLDDAAYQRITGIASHAATRYAVHVLVNRLLARCCAENEIAFVDTWAAETTGGVVRPGFLRDDIHLGREAAEIKLRAYYNLVQGW